MSDFFKEHRKVSPEAAEEGVWIEGAHYDGALDIKVRRMNSEKAQAVRRRLEKPYRNMRTIPDKKQRDLNKHFIAEAVLLDWRASSEAPAEFAKGLPSCTKEVALQAFNDDPDLLEAVAYFAAEEETFRAERLEEEEGNSETSSLGSSSGGSTKSSSKTA